MSKDIGVDHDQPVLTFGSILEGITQVSFSNGEFEVLSPQVAQICNDDHLIDVTSHFSPEINFQEVNVVITVTLNIWQFIDIDQCCLVQKNRPSHEVLTYVLISSQLMVLFEWVYWRVFFHHFLFPSQVLKGGLLSLFEVVFLGDQVTTD